MARQRNICIINGHPDPAPQHLCAALAKAYQEGAEAAGHATRRIDVGALDFPLLRRPQDFAAGEVPAPITAAQEDILWADHVVLVYPLWLGMLPAVLKGFLEQIYRNEFAMKVGPTGWTAKLTGRSARVVVTMAMPGLFYRLWFGAHSLKALRANILGFAGMRPVRSTVIGLAAAGKASNSEKWTKRMRALGRSAR